MHVPCPVIVLPMFNSHCIYPPRLRHLSVTSFLKNPPCNNVDLYAFESACHDFHRCFWNERLMGRVRLVNYSLSREGNTLTFRI